jgi:hypothetical protein
MNEKQAGGDHESDVTGSVETRTGKTDHVFRSQTVTDAVPSDEAQAKASESGAKEMALIGPL